MKIVLYTKSVDVVVRLSLGFLLTARATQAYALEPQHEPHRTDRAQLQVDVVFGLSPLEAEHSRGLLPAAALEGASTREQPEIFGSTQSLLFAGFYAINPSLHLGARSALTLGSKSSADLNSGSALAALSNVEIESEYLWDAAPNTEAAFAVAFALPTAQGHEPTDDLIAQAPPHPSIADLRSLHGELSEAAAMSRGFEDGALFRAERFGAVLKLHVMHHSGRLRIESQLKLENLLSVRSAPHHAYLAELVVGSFYGFDLLKQVTLGVRVWSNMLLEDLAQTILVCEPQLQIRGARFQALIGALMPVVQRRDMPTGLTGLRLAAAALF